jgi:hypothetical protein
MTTTNLDDKTIRTLHGILQDYAVSEANAEQLSMLHADEHKTISMYVPPPCHTSTNTAYISLLADIFEWYADMMGEPDLNELKSDTLIDTTVIEQATFERVACFMESKRLRQLLGQLPRMSWSVREDIDWLEQGLEERKRCTIEEIETDSDGDPHAPFKITLLPDEGETELNLDVEHKDKEEKKNDIYDNKGTVYWKSPSFTESKPLTTRALVDAVEWAVKNEEAKEFDILSHVYAEGDAGIDRSQFTSEQREFLISAFLTYSRIVKDKHVSTICAREANRLMYVNNGGTLRLNRDSDSKSNVDWNTSTSARVVMKAPPATISNRSLRTETKWCQDFCALASHMMAHSHLTEDNSELSRLARERFRETLPVALRTSIEIEPFVRLMCAEYTLPYLKQVLNSMGGEA